MAGGLGMSDAALARSKHAQSWDGSRERRRMARGPYLDEDGKTLVIPSERGWSGPRVRETWRRMGFRWAGYDGPHAYSWVRDVSEPLPGYDRPHRPEVWLQSVRKRFYRFYSQLRYDVQRKGEVADGL